MPDETDSTEIRSQILRRFETWLDDVLLCEEPPSGLDAEILGQLQNGGSGTVDLHTGSTDLYSTWSALVALTQETRLQGRSFKQLQEQLAPLDGLSRSLPSVLSAHEEAMSVARSIAEDARAIRSEQDRQEVQAARQKVRQKVMDMLLDVRDRLMRGRNSARDHLSAVTVVEKPGWLARFSGRARPDSRHLIEAVMALAKGYELGLVRLDEALQEFGIREVPCDGRLFDPHCMTALDIEETTDVPEGTVLEVYRTGYIWEERTYRAAEVKVARRPQA